MFSDLATDHSNTLVLLAAGWVATGIGWLLVRAAFRYDKTSEKVVRHEIQNERVFSAIHHLQDRSGIDRTDFRIEESR